MATANAAPAAPAGTLLRRWLPAAVTIVGVGVLLRVAYDPWYLNSDARYHLDWAHDIWRGLTPDFESHFAPTPHPLSILISSLALPFGHGGDAVVVWTVLLSFGAVIWLTYRLGETLFSRTAGIIAAAVVLTRPALGRDVLLGYQDVPFMALIVGATLLEARRPKNGLPTLALLGLAGLLRPEAWVLSALYVLYLWRDKPNRHRAKLVAAALAAPLLWALMDVVVTGDPLHSLHGTADLAQEVDRRRSIGDVPYWGLRFFAFTLREPVTVGVVVGIAFAARHAWKKARLPLAVIAAMTAVFAIGPIFGLPLIARYIRTPSVLLALFFGLALVGWTTLPKTRERTGWLLAALATAALFIAFLPSNVDQLHALHTRSAREGGFWRGIEDAGGAKPVRAAFERCGAITTTDNRPIPYLRYWLDADPGQVGTIEKNADTFGKLVLTPRHSFQSERFYGKNFPEFTPPPGYRTLYQNRNFRVYAASGC
jgi:mannose/fructose/N-acetylgalactosamine-specific phosphotransferase system component IIC